MRYIHESWPLWPSVEKAKADFSAGLENSACVLGELQDALGIGSLLLFDTAMSMQHTWTDEIKSQGSLDLAIELEHVEDPTEVRQRERENVYVPY